ncbi:AEC family transporter [Clostridium aminobutyricum]|uniref:AEC family transporter n=1 Tax=Clostridium aminobutyricum TaxID=33953 RepID=A0A939IK01_CLOAM|nr:AEC family transporter [Clostridium aminobutyricum]MBN7774089.1 AEC family transporter [Clostridium aminobutyricum]
MYGSFLVLFALMATGYFLAKRRIFNDETSHAMNKFVVYFAYPCLVVQKISTLEMEKTLFMDFLITVVLSTALLYLYHAISYLYGKARKFPRENANVAEFAMTSPNDGFMGFPIALLFYGEKGLLFMLAHNAALNLYFYTLGVTMLKRNQKDKTQFGFLSVSKFLAKLMLNPNIVALITGLLLCGLHVSMPQPLNDYLLYIGNVATPMAMIYIGTSLSKSNLFDILKDKLIIESSLVKLVWLPVLTFLIVLPLPLSDLIKITCIVGACYPTAAMVPILAEQAGQDPVLGSRILFLSTALSALTIPLAIQLLGLFI